MQTGSTRLLRVVVAFLAVTVASAVLLAPADAAARTTLKCKSGDLRYPFTKGGPKTFGVFRLKVTGGTCATAHAVAKDWKKKFEGAIRAGHLNVPTAIDGFSFKTLPAHAAQTYSERGKKRTTTITFDYRIPNG